MIVFIAGIWLNSFTVTSLEDVQKSWGQESGCMVGRLDGRFTDNIFLKGVTCVEVAKILNGKND